MTTISVETGDVTEIPSDALITAINSGGMWFGGVDRAIMRAAGHGFHSVAEAHMPLENGQVIHATREQAACYGPAVACDTFQSVLFIVDDLIRPLANLVSIALCEADRLGLRTVSMPMMRTGVMAGVYETPRQAVYGMASAIRSYVTEIPPRGHSIEKINVVFYGQLELALELESVVQV